MAHGDGSIRSTPTGRFIARYWGPDHRQHSRTFDRKTDARTWLAEARVDSRRGSWIDPSKASTPFGEWATEWFEGRHRLGPQARARDASLLRNHILPVFGDRAIGKITPVEIRRWVNGLVNYPLSPRTIRSCYLILGGALRAAVSARLIGEAPTGRGVVDLPGIERKRERFLSQAELARLLLEFEGDRDRLIVLTAAYSGCRWQEVTGLRRTNLDLERGILHVRSVVVRDGGRSTMKEFPKTDAGRRSIKLPAPVVAELRAYLEGLDDAADGGLVFSSSTGQPVGTDNFRTRKWNPAVDRAELAPFTFHDLRHTHVAWLIDAGVQPLAIQRRLGHKDIATTMNVYGHLFPHHEDAIVQALEQKWDEKGPDNVVRIGR